MNVQMRRPARGRCVVGGFVIAALLASVTVAQEEGQGPNERNGLLPKKPQCKEKTPEFWWPDGADFENGNADMNDPGDSGVLGPPWMAPRETAYNRPAGSGVTTIEPFGGISQVVQNEVNVYWYKEYAFELTYALDANVPEQYYVRITPLADLRTPWRLPPHDYPLPPTGGETVTRVCYYRFKEQPAMERIEIRNDPRAVEDNNSISDEVIFIDKFDFKTNCVFRKSSVFYLSYHSGGRLPGGDGGMLAHYDPETGELGFSDTAIALLNANGGYENDPAFADDPLQGAVVSIAGLTLDRMEPNGIWFTDGTLTIHRGHEEVYFTASIPHFWLGSECGGGPGGDLLASLFDPAFSPSSQSAWLNAYRDIYRLHDGWPTLFLTTAGNLEHAVRTASEPISVQASFLLGTGIDPAAAFITIDDFEAYTSDEPARIFDAWLDGLDDPGNGSIVGYETAPFTERTIVYRGHQSMPVWYDNTEATISEVIRDWPAPQNWLVEGFETLRLYVHGAPDNDAAALYVGVEDHAGGLAVSVHPDPEALLTPEWTAWSVSLGEFAEGGVDLAAVTSLFLGVGDRNTPLPGGQGLAYVDEVRLAR